MSISRALGAEKPAAKRPRSYMEGFWGRKLSIMSTVLPNTPSQKSKEQMLSIWGGYVKQNKGAHHEHHAGALGAEKPATKRPRSYTEGPRGGKASCKKSKKMYMVAASPPRPSSRPGALCACAILSIYLSIYIYFIYPSIYIIHMHIYTSLSLSLSLSLKAGQAFGEGLGGRTCALRSCNSKTSKRI